MKSSTILKTRRGCVVSCPPDSPHEELHNLRSGDSGGMYLLGGFVTAALIAVGYGFLAGLSGDQNISTRGVHESTFLVLFGLVVGGHNGPFRVRRQVPLQALQGDRGSRNPRVGPPGVGEHPRRPVGVAVDPKFAGNHPLEYCSPQCRPRRRQVP